MKDVREVLARLGKSEFRSRVELRKKELDYLKSRGMETVLKHAADFIAKRLAPAEPVNDGRQTPWHSHPVFVAQHATATCCRGCLRKWHEIPKGRELTDEEKRYIVDVIEAWLSRYEASAGSVADVPAARSAHQSRR
ncbi:MAG TPA: DUF4186 domain-containing protein [Pyrinomonadaceae bacterium]